MTIVTTRRQAPRQKRVVQKIVTGDRICVHCGYNLFGQEIFREEHYSMLVVRCPECATIASVQDNPLVSRWASRWGAVLAALWFVVVFGAGQELKSCRLL